jgi:hypothetical protein
MSEIEKNCEERTSSDEMSEIEQALKEAGYTKRHDFGNGHAIWVRGEWRVMVEPHWDNISQSAPLPDAVRLLQAQYTDEDVRTAVREAKSQIGQGWTNVDDFTNAILFRLEGTKSV